LAQLRRVEHPDPDALGCFLEEQGLTTIEPDDLNFLVGAPRQSCQ
jgi:hypothetical protein